jgi:hypothetical protein
MFFVIPKVGIHDFLSETEKIHFTVKHIGCHTGDEIRVFHLEGAKV